MFEGEGDKKKKVYPRLPDMLGKKDTPKLFILMRVSDYSPYWSFCLILGFALISL